MGALHVRTVGNVVIDVSTQSVIGKVLVHRQGLGRAAVFMAEQGQPGVGMNLLQEREEITPMAAVGRGLIDPPDELGKDRRFKLIHWAGCCQYSSILTVLNPGLASRQAG